jgi:hypothetical protein
VGKDGVLYVTGSLGPRAVLPAQLRPQLLTAYHDDAGHLDAKHTAASILRSFAWPGLAADVTAWCASCLRCRARHANSRGRHAVASFAPEPSRNFEEWVADVSGPFTAAETNANEAYYNLSFIDKRSRWVECAVITVKKGKGKRKGESVTAKKAIAAFIQRISRRYGCPTVVSTDNGSEFMESFDSVLADMKIEHRRSTPHGTHTGVSLVERWHGSMWHRLATSVPESVGDWQDTISAAAAQHNSTPSAGVGACSPFEAVFHQRCVRPIEAAWRMRSGAPLETMDEHLERHFAGRASLQRKRVEQAAASGSRTRFRVGDEVWAYSPPPNSCAATRKLLSFFVPATIAAVTDDAHYTVRLAASGSVVKRHIDDLRPRADRTALLRKWHCKPIDYSRATGGDDVQPQQVMATAFAIPNARAAKSALKTIKVGTRIIMGIELAMSVDAAVYDGSPVTMEGTVTRWDKARGAARIAWLAGPDGKRPEQSDEILVAARGHGTVSDFQHGTLDDGHWAVYTGTRCDQPFQIHTLALRQGQRDALGRQGSMFRVRLRGLSPEVDWVASQAEIEEQFPGDAPSMLLEASARWRALS